MVSQTQSMQIRQAQTLVMTPQMQQSLKILQLSTLDLSNFIEQELQNNPLLERDIEDHLEKSQENSTQDNNAAEDNFSNDNNLDSFDNLSNENLSNESQALDADINDSWNSNEQNIQENNKIDFPNSNNSLTSSSTYNGEDDAGSIIEKTYTKEQTLKDFLNEQINIDFEDNRKKVIAAHIIDMVDQQGYLSNPKLDEEIIELAERLGSSVKEIYSIIEDLQTLEPTGVCARNLQECLKLQLQEIDHLDPLMEKFIDNLDLLAKGEIAKLKKACGVDDEEIKEMITEVKSLNPRPSSGFLEEEIQVKYPDLFLTKENDEWRLEINSDALPKIALKKEFYDQLKALSLKDDEKKYITDNYASASFLIRSVGQRASTMLKTAAIIIKYQKDFFEKGINYLKPIGMKTVAEEIGMHESTIGRVVSNKFIETPRGIFELKYFFTNSLSSTYGDEEISTETVKHQVRELIENEDKILSDEQIANILKEGGINIARRTVAKYRENLGIPTSAERKRARKISG